MPAPAPASGGRWAGRAGRPLRRPVRGPSAHSPARGPGSRPRALSRTQHSGHRRWGRAGPPPWGGRPHRPGRSRPRHRGRQSRRPPTPRPGVAAAQRRPGEGQADRGLHLGQRLGQLVGQRPGVADLRQRTLHPSLDPFPRHAPGTAGRGSRERSPVRLAPWRAGCRTPPATPGLRQLYPERSRFVKSRGLPERAGLW